MTAAVAATSAKYARDLTDRIKVAVEGTWHLITEAYTSRAWAELGYSSWDDYCTREFGTSRLRLPREERQEVVSSLREQGLSLRAIAAVTGDSHETVRTVAAAGVKNLTPDPDRDVYALAAERIANDNGVRIPLADVEAEFGQLDEFERKIADDELARSEGTRVGPSGESEPAAEPAPQVTGTDGKTYAAKATRTAPYRKPLPDVAKTAGWELRKAMERVEKLFDDNRYRQNEQQVALALRGHLLYVAETVAAVLDQLP